jgi:hypothetical protein
MIVAQAHAKTTAQVTAHVTAESEAVQSQILLAARNIIGTLKTNNAAVLKQLQDTKEVLANQMKGKAVAREAQDTADLFGDASQPAGLCGSTGLGGGIQVSGAASSSVKHGLQTNSVEHVDQFREPAEYLFRILDADHPDLQKANEAMFPQSLTLSSAQIRDAVAALNTVSNPRPTPALTDAQMETPAGQTYTALRLINETRTTFAAEALNRHLTFHSPTLPDDVTQWAKEQWANAGAGGNPPGVVDGKMSEAALYNLLSQIRMGNPNWYMEIASLNDTGLLREMAVISAAQFELTRKNTELLDRISVLLSMQLTANLEATGKKEVEAAYSRTISTQQK